VKLEDLVCLMKRDNGPYVTVVDLDHFSWEDKIEIDLEREEWKIPPSSNFVTRERGPFQIGSAVELYGRRTYPYGLIGLYNRTEVEHMSAMACSACSIGSRSIP
jgi:hypothetical protein